MPQPSGVSARRLGEGLGAIGDIRGNPLRPSSVFSGASRTFRKHVSTAAALFMIAAFADCARGIAKKLMSHPVRMGFFKRAIAPFVITLKFVHARKISNVYAAAALPVGTLDALTKCMQRNVGRPRFVRPEKCSSCTGEPHVDESGQALFCADCFARAHAGEERYDIGRGGRPDANKL